MPHYQDLERDTGLLRHDDLRRVTSGSGRDIPSGTPEHPVVAKLMEPLRKPLEDLEKAL